MSCENCGSQTTTGMSLCADCRRVRRRENDERPHESYGCPDCDGSTSGEDVSCYRCRSSDEQKIRADGGSNPVQAVLDCVRERTESEPDGTQHASSNVWTSIRRLKNDAQRTGSSFSKSDLTDAVATLQENDDLLNWYGLLAPTDDEHLHAIVENEQLANFSRSALVAECQALLDEPADVAGREVATDGGRVVDPSSALDERNPIPTPQEYGLVAGLAGETLIWMGDDHRGRDPYTELLAFALATFVDGVPITPLGYVENEELPIDTRDLEGFGE